ncbi:MAG: PHP domain-containing protein [Oscillospiraceae bacterium]|nr:PHP domain-containing protein [Candidatus Ruminococcus equi]
MKCYYDLHIHSCLSPCGSMDMTPNNIVNMAKLLGLSAIALTDHNTVHNCEALIKVGQREDICVVPGMELTTSEEIHIVCLFPTLEDAKSFCDYVSEHQIKIKNRADIYGRQVIMDSDDNEISELENLLVMATDISIMNVAELAESYNGIAFPAHIDRSSMSILSVLGEISESYNFSTVELADITQKEKWISAHPILKNMNIITNCDAHYLEHMKEAENFFELDEITPKAIIEKLKNRI